MPAASRARRRAAAVAAAVLLAAGAFAGGSRAAGPPHIVYFLADDLGWNDVGYHGSEIATPNLDSLAAEGVRLDQYYVQPRCTPSRAALLTGRYPIRYGLQEGVLWPWTRGGLPLSERTLAEDLGALGYRTVLIGKWHLGMSAPEYLPLARGFEHHYGLYAGLIDYYTHVYQGGLDWHRNGRPVREKGYATILLAREAIRVIEGHDGARPLFLVVAWNAPHSPLQAPREYLERYASLADENRRLFAAMTTTLDDGVGRVLAAIDARGWRERTLVIFASDNGGSKPHGGSNRPLRGEKGSLYEGSVRVPALLRWPGRLTPGSVVRQPVHVSDWLPTLVGLAGGAIEPERELDGVDVWPALSAGAALPRIEMLLNVSRLEGGIRVGDWKLLSRFGARATSELFDLARDPGERRNLAGQRPDKVAELSERLDAYRRRAVQPRVFPSPRKPLGFRPPAVWGDPPRR